MTTITEGQWTQFVDNILDGRERRDYSGRGMYGERCPAVVTDESPFTVGSVAHDVFGDRAFDLDVRSDSMGLSTVIYFPNLEIVEDY